MHAGSNGTRHPLIVVGPLPPPIHGVTISTSLVLQNPHLRSEFRVAHLDTSDRRGLENLGTWDPTNIWIALKNILRLARLLRTSEGLLYLPLSQNRPAFLRDAAFIHLANLRGWKVAVHLRGGEFDRFYTDCGPCFRLLIRTTLRRIASIAVLGSGLRSMFDGLVEEARLRVVTNGTPDLNLTPEVRRADHVLFMANLLRRKGVVEAVEAALIVVARHPSARFVFAGTWEDEDLRRQLQAEAATAGGRIEFVATATGPEKERLLAEAGIFVFTPREPEGHPRVVLEAMSAGLPVITTDRGALKETVVDGQTGFVLEDPTPQGIAASILHLLERPEERFSMGVLAKARHDLHFTQERADIALASWLGDVIGTVPSMRQLRPKPTLSTEHGPPERERIA
jgi:glycosyltransferase involved in cell wall biosynthesis